MRAIFAIIIIFIIIVLNVLLFKRLNNDIPENQKDAEKDMEAISLLYTGTILSWIFLLGLIVL